MATGIAAQQVFNTHELLEMILSNLVINNAHDVKTLLLSQRVNITFQSVIQQSRVLQEHLSIRVYFADSEYPEEPPWSAHIACPLAHFLKRAFGLDICGGDKVCKISQLWAWGPLAKRLVANRTGSWRRMKVVQFHSADIQWRIHVGGYDSADIVKESTTPTFGQVVDLLVAKDIIDRRRGRPNKAAMTSTTAGQS